MAEFIMSSILITYASRDGQAQSIAFKLAEHLQAAALGCKLLDLHSGAPDSKVLAQFSLVVLVAAVRYGKHLPVVTQWLERDSVLLNQQAFAIVSVNLIARNAHKRCINSNAYLRRLLHQHKLKPVAACAIAGKLDYPRYRWLDRQMIRMIMALTGGPTDTKVTTEFTDWSVVESFAGHLRDLIRQN